MLRCSITYDIAVGYFSSKWIKDAAAGIASIAARGGRTRWIISPELSEEDWEMLKDASEETTETLVHEIVKRSVESLVLQLVENTRDTIAWMIRDKILEFRIAIPKQKLSGIFHAKIGVAKDSEGETVAFSGSYNLTGAAENNWETIEIYYSARESELSRINRKEREFERMWSQADPNLKIFKPNDQDVEPFIRITQRVERPYTRLLHQRPKIPSRFTDANNRLREHQELAIKNWFAANGQGVFNMATGSGKTVTALSGVTRLLDHITSSEASIVVLALVPFRHLAEQWAEEARDFGFTPIMCFGDYPSWPDDVGKGLLELKNEAADNLFLIAVNATFSTPRFLYFIDQIDTNFLIIADEMHNLGSPGLRQALPSNARFRMGLSATPIRKYDDKGTMELRQYFGEDVIEYGLRDAISDGTLTQYRYYPELIRFTETEMEEYRDLSYDIARAFSIDENVDSNERLKNLLIKRARLISNAENKLPRLLEILKANSETGYNLIYVGDGSVEDERQIEIVLKAVGLEAKLRARKFTAEESSKERKEILDAFGSGELQAIVAIRCLDEGVDIPRTETAYIMSSSSNPRQFIQRRGRVLRKAAGKKLATIYDFVVIPPMAEEHRFSEDDAFAVERNLMKRELERIGEFSESAINGPEAYSRLREIVKKLKLLDV
ncbi:MAG: DEAD/DEAH box helicase family protein [Pseudomonadales bacterium]